MILIDTNVLIDILSCDENWYSWSKAALVARATEGLLINEIVYAELAPQYGSQSALDDAIAEFDLIFERAPKSALFAAGRTFDAYRKRGGTRTSLLPDFFIGAHAATADIPILTRDARRYQTYFPEVALIAPE